MAEQTALLAFDRQNHMGASDTLAQTIRAAIQAGDLWSSLLGTIKPGSSVSLLLDAVLHRAWVCQSLILTFIPCWMHLCSCLDGSSGQPRVC